MFTIRIFSISFLCVLFFTQCEKEQKDLFAESAAIRLNKAIVSIDSTLTHTPNGWLMQYFATTESPGYSMLIKFSDNGEVIVSAKNELVNEKYTQAKSVFDVIGDNGPVLTFNSYNNVLHIFSNPENPAGAGLEGDYEFIVSNYSDSIINLKGKKRGTEISLYRLSESDSWPAYFDELDKMNNKLFGADPLYFISGKDTLSASKGAVHVFEFHSNSSADVSYVPFVITTSGLKFYSAYTTSNNKKVQSFYLSEDGVTLYAENDKNVYFAGKATNLYFVNSQTTYSFDTTQMSDHFKVPVRELCLQMKEKYRGKRNVDFIALSYKPGFGSSFHISTTPTVTLANYKIDLILEPKNQDVLTIKKEVGVFDQNGEVFYSKVDAIDHVWTELNGTYKLKSTLAKKEVKFTDINNESRYFVVNKR